MARLGASETLFLEKNALGKPKVDLEDWRALRTQDLNHSCFSGARIVIALPKNLGVISDKKL
ncbi:MAG: hypothetical protein ACP5IM_03210 [Candidatus Bathyarchaeia archaeon]|nr:MAG: hypothetical protein C0195_03165 [Candidatus Bathyarchaeota archaeon]